MAKIYKIGENGKIMSGAELVKYASKTFTGMGGSHGLGSSGRPKNVKQAESFIDRYTNKKGYWKLGSGKKWIRFMMKR